MIEVEILGPLVLRVEGQEARLGPMLRALVAALVCADGYTLTAAGLARRLWEIPAPSALDTLRSHIAHARDAMCRAAGSADNVLGQRLLITEKTPIGVSYRLRLQPEHVDVTGFDRLIRAGQAALRLDQFGQAAGHLGDALALWRGRPLADVAHLPFARAHIAHLRNLRVTALLGRIEADIWSGHFREVIGELEVLMAECPDDGSVARLLVTSLYLSERLAEAAFTCHQAIVGLQAHGLSAGPMEELQHHVLNRTLPRRGLLAA
jgi:SARP family transcriptional regulator, regulator of embCAB operon